MDQTDSAFNLGDVIDALGVTLPTVDEQPPANDDSAPAEPETEEATVPEEQTDTTDNTDSDSETDPSDPPESSEETDDDDSESDDASTDDDEQAPEPAAVRKLTKRVDKLTARAKSAEEQAATLQAELAAAKDALTRAQPIVLQDASDPLSDVQSPAELEHRLASANTVLDNVPDLIAKADMEGGEVEIPMGDGSVRKFTKAELQERLRTARQIIKAEPARRNYFAQRETYIAEARTAYPEIFQEGSQLQQVMVGTLKAFPGIAKLPNLELIIGDAMRGQALRFQQAEAMAKKSAAAKPKPVAAKPAVAPKVVAPSAAPKSKTPVDPLETLKSSGNRAAAENFVASLLS